jgi:2-polyprenyl-3-methyl-5-hydroxy-6-metoxy-1,4-benzoquinol methylase
MARATGGGCVTFDLTEDELKQIEDWYYSAAGESATTDGTADGNARLKALLDKFGFKYHPLDEEDLKSDMTDLTDCAREIAAFLGRSEAECLARLQLGFGYQHKRVNDDFRRVNPRTEAELLDWYRTTEEYIWELSAYHADPGFNYSGMCAGIAERLKAEGMRTVLCLGDGIGDLTLTLARAGFEAWYHDLHDSQTMAFAQSRFAMYGVDFRYLATPDFDPAIVIGGEGDDARPFDAVVSLDYLEHVVNVDLWVEAIFETLMPGGIFVAQNAFNIGSGKDGSIPMHLDINDRYEKEWDALLFALGFTQMGPQWYRKPA